MSQSECGGDLFNATNTQICRPIKLLKSQKLAAMKTSPGGGIHRAHREECLLNKEEIDQQRRNRNCRGQFHTLELGFGATAEEIC